MLSHKFIPCVGSMLINSLGIFSVRKRVSSILGRLRPGPSLFSDSAQFSCVFSIKKALVLVDQRLKFSDTMVQKYQSPVRVYKYPFELVMAVSQLMMSLKILKVLGTCQNVVIDSKTLHNRLSSRFES